jgi:hypothetical protein
MRKQAKKCDTFFTDEEAEVVRKAVSRHGKEDDLKSVLSFCRTSYFQQENFTICVLVAGSSLYPGVAKRNTNEDCFDNRIGKDIALSRAVKRFVLCHNVKS